MTQPLINDIITALEQHAVETGLPLPIDASTIAMIEAAWGGVVDLDTGRIVDVAADDGVQPLDARTWLAGLEAACGGRVVVHWSMTPEAYFAQLTNDEVTA